MKNSHPELSARLRALTTELRALDVELKSDKTPDVVALQDFRSMLDDVRLTAWTVNELMTARESGRNTGPVLSFLAAERLRRLARMMSDVSADIQHGHLSWESSGVQPLSDSSVVLQARLAMLLANHRAQFHRVSDGSR
jgi:hypothetical protein